MNNRKLDILKRNYNMTCHNLLCYSTSFMMNKPKIGYEKQWKETKEEISLLEAWMKELENRVT